MADDLTAILAGIRASTRFGTIAYADNHTCPDVANSCSAHHALRLLAAVDAALKLADNAIPVVAALHCTCAAGSPDACSCQDTTAAWTLDPAKIRAAITAALTGEQIASAAR